MNASTGFDAAIAALKLSMSRCADAWSWRAIGRRAFASRMTVLAQHALCLAPQQSFADMAGAIKPADIVLLLVDHKQFRRVDRQSLREKGVIDTRGIWR